jgi:pyruvyl transferase EpsO
MNHSTPEQVKELLHKAIGKLETVEQCALLDYPDHPNIGDHLIWLGEIFYLNDVLKTQINYAASVESFSASEMEKQVGKAPIFLHGGGNLGDLWPNFQKFREQIISQYRDRPVIILPQSIYFADKDKLKESAKVFNSHPNLTLFVRDNYSYELAIQYFSNCQVIKSPDMAFQMVNMPDLSSNYAQKHTILYHCRKDEELNPTLSSISIDLPNLVVEDWASYKYYSEYSQNIPKTWFNQRLARISEGWQKGTVIPNEWISRQIWKSFHPWASKFNTIYNPSLHRSSWNLMHHGVYQFKQHRLIITNRLHGHILCVLLDIPHVFLPNSYYKNEGFYESWTHSIPFCRFVKDASQIEFAAQELLELFSNNSGQHH